MRLPGANTRLASVGLFLFIVLFGALALNSLRQNKTRAASQLLTVSATAAAVLAAQIGYLAFRSMSDRCTSRRDTAGFLVLVLVMLAAPVTLFSLALVALKASDANDIERASRMTDYLIIIGAVSAFAVVGPPPNLFK